MPLVKLYAGLRAAAGVKDTQIEGGLLRELLEALVERYPALEGKVIDGAGLRPHVVVTINGNHVDPEGSLEIPVGPDDQVAIFPPIAGG